MRKTQRPGLAGIIGQPLDHSLSPFIHNLGFSLQKLPYVFVKIEIPPAKLARIIGALVDLGFIGANVTMPHKEAVVDLIDSLSPEAEAVGAVNTLVVKGNRIKGYNSDIDGFARSLGSFARGRKFPTATLLGAGGAAAAVAYALFHNFGTRNFHFVCRNWR
ncbi:MAG: shikimate dehydrogenase family protein [Limisphaerales bacterium]